MMTPVERLSKYAGLAPPQGHYSHAVRAGEHLFISGQLPDFTSVADVDFARQARRVLERILLILGEAGGSADNLAKVTAYIVGVDNWPAFNAVYAEMMGNCRPARAVVPVPELHHGWLIELEATAYLPQSRALPFHAPVLADGK